MLAINTCDCSQSIHVKRHSGNQLVKGVKIWAMCICQIESGKAVGSGPVGQVKLGRTNFRSLVGVVIML